MERVVTVKDAGIDDDDYVDAILLAIDEGRELERSSTFGEGRTMVVSVSLHRFVDPLMFRNRWAVVVDAEDYEVRDYDDISDAVVAYGVLSRACADDGVYWSFFN